MKKMYSLICMLIIPWTLSAQWYGDGLSAGTAYYGIINSSFPLPSEKQWNTTNYSGGVVYVGRTGTPTENDLVIGSGGTLTIGQGIIVKFCTTSSDLRTTGTGVLNALGSSSGNITFTKDVQATWGHLSITGSGTCQLSFCTIEWGRKTGVFEEGYGGGLHINNSNVIISNCVFKNNYALWGGGIMVDASVSPVINNCLIYSNTSLNGGGGIEIDPGSGPAFNNCIIRNNTNTSSTYGGGGLLLWQSGSAKFSNCTIVNNTSSGNNGVNVYFYGTNSGSIINTIAWSHENCVFFNGAYQSSRLINSAVQRAYNSTGTIALTSFTNCYDLGSSNTGTDGPNFVNPSISDYLITFVSPCRDAGATTDPAIPNDYAGNPRIGPYDVGAYEVQYSRWAGGTSGLETSWTTTTNWTYSILPSTSMNVVVPNVTYDPIISAGDVTITNLFTETGGLLTVNADRLLTATNITNNGTIIFNPLAKGTITILINNGTLTLESDATGCATLIPTTYTDNGTENIELYLTGGYVDDPLNLEGRWHYISSPVSLLSVSTFSPGTTLDLAMYDETWSNTSLVQGWFAYDGYNYSLGDEVIGKGFTTLYPGWGYNFWDDLFTNTFTFGGTLNTGNPTPVEVNLSNTTSLPRTDLTLAGYNLIGNPYSSGLNWNSVIMDASYPAQTSKAIYFTSENSSCAYVNSFAVPSGCGATGIIPPMQGFFVRAHATGQKITFSPGVRTHDNIHSRYKGSEIIPFIRLAICKTGGTDETVVRFDELAKPDLDLDFDAEKIFMSSTKESIYSLLGNKKYAINGQPLPETSLEIPIALNIITSGNHTISATELQGLEGYYVTLKDNLTGFTADLKTTPDLSFSASVGLISDRFILKFTNILTGTEYPVSIKTLFNIYPSDNYINIQTLADEWDSKTGSVKVLDMSGKIVSELRKTEFSKNSVTQIGAPDVNGLYFIEIKSGVSRYVGKVVIK